MKKDGASSIKYLAGYGRGFGDGHKEGYKDGTEDLSRAAFYVVDVAIEALRKDDIEKAFGLLAILKTSLKSDGNFESE